MKKTEVQDGMFVIKAVHDEHASNHNWYLYINEHGVEKWSMIISHEPTSIELKQILETYLKGGLRREKDK